MSRICLDSNVLVAAFAARGLCADLLRLILSEHHLVIPEVVVEEARRVLREKIRVDQRGMASFDAVVEQCEVAPSTDAPSPTPVRDPDDERVLADALAADCELLVTGDDDLLSVASGSPIPILSPRAFMTLARGGGP